MVDTMGTSALVHYSEVSLMWRFLQLHLVDSIDLSCTTADINDDLV